MVQLEPVLRRPLRRLPFLLSVLVREVGQEFSRLCVLCLTFGGCAMRSVRVSSRGVHAMLHSILIFREEAEYARHTHRLVDRRNYLTVVLVWRSWVVTSEARLRSQGISVTSVKIDM